MNIFENKRGSVTVFLSLIMSGVLLFTVIMVDASKIIGARSMVAGAGNMALSAGLTNYNSVLQDTYGIFAVSKDMKELEKNLEVYFEATLKANGIEDMGLASRLVDLVIGGDISELMNFQSESFTLNGVKGSELTQTAALKTQILEYSKYRAPVVIGYGFLEKLNILKTLPKQQEALEKKVEYEKKLSSIEKLCKEIYENAAKYEKHLTTVNGNPETDEMYYAPSSPDTIMNSNLKPTNRYTVRMTRNTIAYVMIEKKVCSEDWQTDSGNDNGSLESSKENFEQYKGRVARLEELYQEVAKAQLSSLDRYEVGGRLVEVWEYYESAVQYYEYYTANIDLFQNVPSEHSKAKKEYERKRDSLKREIENADEDEDVWELVKALKKLNDDWDKLDTWYQQQFKKVIGVKYDWSHVQDFYLEALKKEIDYTGSHTASSLRYTYNWAEELEEYAEATIKGLNDLKKEAGKLEELSIAWNTSISELESSDVKSSMELEHTNKAEVMKEEHITAMIDILERGLTYAQDIKFELEQITYIQLNFVEDNFATREWLDNLTYAAVKGEITEETVIRTNQQLADFQEQLHEEKGFYTAINETESNMIYNVQWQAYWAGMNRPILWNYIKFVQVKDSRPDKTDSLYEFLERSVNAGKVDKEEKENKKKEQNKMADSVPAIDVKDVPDKKVENVMTPDKKEEAPDGTSLSVTNEKEAEDTVDNAVNTTGSALDKFNLMRLDEILTSGRDKLYMMTYATNMFSCYTTKEGETTLTNVQYSAKNNVLFKAEQEYILWGSDDAKANVNATVGTIFGIRLLLNIIYAYTGDPQLKTETLTMATAIAGWTGFGVPIVQNALLVVAAVAETTSDVNRLLDGDSVPLYKTVSTWSFRYSTLGKNVEDLVQEAIDKGSTRLYEEMNKLTDHMTEDMLKEFNKELRKYIDNVIETTVSTAINSVQAPVMEVILWAASHMEDEAEMMEKDIVVKVDECFARMEKIFQDEKDNAGTSGAILAEMKLQALSYYNTPENKKALVDMMVEASGINDGVNQTNALSEKVKGWFEDRSSDITKELKDYIEKSGIIDELNEQIKSTLSETNTNVQEAVNDKLNEFMNKMGSSSTTISTTDSENLFANFDSVSASTFSMNYQEYVMVFMAIRFLAAEEAAINCMGNLIQANATEEKSLYYAGKDFKLESAYTMLQLESEASIKPTFIKLPDFTADLAGTGVERYPIKYQGVLGY